MRQSARHAIGAALAALAAASPTAAQKLHVNDHWDDCAIVLSHTLTQDAWRQFVAELGVVAYYRPMVSARPLGRGHIEFAIAQTATRIDDSEPAWNDTFSHPDSTHYLFDGDALAIPGFMLRVGVSDRVDVGAYFTKNPNSNYGIAGAQVQYSLVQDARTGIAAAGRITAARLFGPDDVSAGVYGVDLLVSRDVSVFSPYAGISGFVSHGSEHSSHVDLAGEAAAGVQGMVGVALNVWALRLGAEYSVARVSGYAFKVAFGI